MATNAINNSDQEYAGVTEVVTHTGQSDSRLKTRYEDAYKVAYLYDDFFTGTTFGGLSSNGDNGQYPMSDFYSLDLQTGTTNNNRVFVSYGQIEFQD